MRLPIFADMVRMGQAPLPGTETPLIPPMGVGMDVSKIGGIPGTPGKNIPPLPFGLAFRSGTNLLTRPILIRSELLGADLTFLNIYVKIFLRRITTLYL